MKRGVRFCLDAFAWLAWLQDEPGAAAVQHCLGQAERGHAECVTSIINLGEAYYRLVRVERREQAESLWRMALRRTLPVAVKEATRRRVRRSRAESQSRHRVRGRLRGRHGTRVSRDAAHGRSGNQAS